MVMILAKHILLDKSYQYFIIQNMYYILNINFIGGKYEKQQ